MHSLSALSTTIVDTHSTLCLALQRRIQEALLVHNALRLIEQLPRIVPMSARVHVLYYRGDQYAELKLEAIAP